MSERKRLIRNSDGKELVPGALVCVLATDTTYRLSYTHEPDRDNLLGLVTLAIPGTNLPALSLYPTAIGAKFV